MTEQTTNPTLKIDWRTRAYLLWTGLGIILGLVAGFVYTRAADEHAARNGGKPPSPGTLELMGLAIAAMALVGQIAELGKPEKSRDR